MTSGQAAVILKAATQLFAALGYDGTSTRQIADAAGLNIATVNYHVGGKRELYLAVMEAAHQAEKAALEQALSRLPGDDPVAAIHRLADDYLDFCVDHPEVPALWMHRWLSDASDITELERQYVQPLLAAVSAALRPAVEAGLIAAETDLDYTVWSVIWTVHGFAKGGVLDAEGRRRAAGDRAALRRFRAHLHQSLHRTLGLPGDFR
ncbi:Homeodomain-like [[Actinomadura] parvosata subsp. kistnae]|uniref:TetR family transcriptional regulator n=1 Tax=[Actinomadura] parvosata subsp. kistnae TaxID=1909395 RepID=A0A1V0AD40_9ACTN|nr:TetR/AcrR family transcriptional regulator [Nonomuraea sp. ATCC 55076]AQZ68141.1 TetR family transcriptional regulator [Nonomuraea sp. ATCC 55076]SPL93470.1 Homeodomain-like [Actinomadura parvosata subsp. kistnae]